MENTLTSLAPTLYESLDVISRELVGFIPAVRLDAGVARAAVGQQVLSYVTPSVTANDLTPGVTAPDDGDQSIGNVALSITKSRGVPVRWNGEEQRSLNNNGPGYRPILVDQFAQAMRTLCNEMENDTAQAAYLGSSRAYGTAGTTPFATAGDFSDASNVLKILKDNGAPLSDAHLVIDTTAGAKMIGLQSRYDVAGDVSMQNQGVLIQKAGLKIRESAAVPSAVAAGTAAGATTNAAGYAVGATVLTLAAAGTGSIVAGDVITFAGDTNKYLVASGDSDVSNGGTITLAAPGLRVAMSAATKAITVVEAATRNIAFDRNAIVLATRAPAIPAEGDMADDAMIITDPRSGLSFEVRLYKQYRQIRYEVAASWGVKAVKSAHIATLLG